MRFEFATATRVIFGPGTLSEVGPIALEMLDGSEHNRALVATGLSIAQTEPLIARLTEHAIECVTFSVAGEPTTELVRTGTEQAVADRCTLIVGFGGGSAIDTGKAIAALLANGGELLDYLEVIGGGRPLANPSAPYIAIPTTAGTGSEVTCNAVLASPEQRVKVSLRSPLMLPRLALVDPELTRDLPPNITAATGLDALTQLVEAYVSVRGNPMTDAICREGIRRAARSLHRAYVDGDCLAAREDMSLASLFSGLALANAGLGAVHGFAGPLGGMFTAPHGAVCAALLPHVMAANVQALQNRSAESQALKRYQEIASMVTGNPQATVDDGVGWVSKLCRSLQIPSLSIYGVVLADLSLLVEKASAASSMKGNPIKLTKEEMLEILTLAL